MLSRKRLCHPAPRQSRFSVKHRTARVSEQGAPRSTDFGDTTLAFDLPPSLRRLYSKPAPDTEPPSGALGARLPETAARGRTTHCAAFEAVARR